MANPAALGKFFRKSAAGSGGSSARRCSACDAARHGGGGGGGGGGGKKGKGKANAKKSRSFGGSGGGASGPGVQSLLLCLTCGETLCMAHAEAAAVHGTAAHGHAKGHFERLRKHCLFVALGQPGTCYCFSCQAALPLPSPDQYIDLFADDDTLSGLLECVGLAFPDTYGRAVAQMKHDEAADELLAKRQEQARAAAAKQKGKHKQNNNKTNREPQGRPPPVEPVDAAVLKERMAKLHALSKLSRRNQFVQYGARGLQNIGNTCFFNSTMQCLGQCPTLLDYFLRSERKRPQGPLAMALHQFLLDQWAPALVPAEAQGALDRVAARDQQQPAANPSTLFGEICRRAPRFYGRRQQDAHELLRYLMDGLFEEEARKVSVMRKLLAQPNKRAKAKWSAEELDAAANEMFALNLFSGELLSIITCHSCGTQTRNPELFFDLSLSIPSVAREDARASAASNNNNKNTSSDSSNSSSSTGSAGPVMSKRQQNLLAKQLNMQRQRERKNKQQNNNSNNNASASPDDQKQEDDCEGSENGKLEGEASRSKEKEDQEKKEKLEGKEEDDENNDEPAIGNLFDDEEEEFQVAANLRSLFSDGDDHDDGPVYVNDDEELAAAIQQSLQLMGDEPAQEVSGEEGPKGKEKEHDEQVIEEEQKEGEGSDLDNGDVAREPVEEESSPAGDRSTTTEKAYDDNPIVQRPRQVLATDWHDRVAGRPGALVDLLVGEARPEPRDDIPGCLSLFFQPESVDQYSCEACARMAAGLPAIADPADADDQQQAAGDDLPPVRRLATRQYVLLRPPRVLTIHLKRFRQGVGRPAAGSTMKLRRAGAGLFKCEERVEFGTTLDLAPFGEREPPPAPSFTAQFVDDAAAVTADHGNAERARAHWRYRLFGVVQHGGSLSGGHYVGYFYHRSRQQWYFASDSRVRPVSVADVLSCQAYLLFFERVPVEPSASTETLDTLEHEAVSISSTSSLLSETEIYAAKLLEKAKLMEP